MSSTSRSVACAAQDAADGALVGDGRRAALLGQEVDGQRREAGSGEPVGDRPDVVGEPSVLMDDEHRATRGGRHRQVALELTPRSRERDGRAGDARHAGW